MSYQPYLIGVGSGSAVVSFPITTTAVINPSDTIYLIIAADTFLPNTGWSASTSPGSFTFYPLSYIPYTNSTAPVAYSFVASASLQVDIGSTIDCVMPALATNAVAIAIGVPNCTSVHSIFAMSGSSVPTETTFGVGGAASQAVGAYIAWAVTNPIEAITAVSDGWNLIGTESQTTLAISAYYNFGTATGVGGLFTLAAATAGLIYGEAQIYPSLYPGQIITVPSKTGSKTATQIEVVTTTGPTTFTGAVIGQPLTNQIPNDPTGALQPIQPSTWSALPIVTNISGLTYLAGKVVSAFVDGNPQGPFTVSASGTISLTNGGANVIVGLGYQGQVKTLRIEMEGEATIQGDFKTIPAASLILNNTLGIKAGQEFAYVQPVPDTSAPFSSPQIPFSGVVHIPLMGEYDVNGQVCIQQDNPLPCTILGIVPEVELGSTQK